MRYEGANQAAMGSPREIIKTAYAYFHFMEEDGMAWKCCVIEMMPHIFIMKKQHSNWLKKFCISNIGVFVSLEQQIRARYGDEVLEQL